MLSIRQCRATSCLIDHSNCASSKQDCTLLSNSHFKTFFTLLVGVLATDDATGLPGAALVSPAAPTV